MRWIMNAFVSWKSFQLRHLWFKVSLFLDCKVTVPVYIFGSAVVTLKQWHWMGFVLSSLVWHVTFAGMMTCVVLAMQYHIAAKLESDDVSSLLLASRCVLRGVCDGDVVVDCCTHRILEDSTSLERLLNVKRKLSGSNFLDLFLDADGRQQFLQFLQSEVLPQERKAAIPPCLRIVLQGAHGPVSTDVFCTSCAAAGQDFYLLALRADPDQFGIPPDAPDPPQSAAWQFDQQRQQRQPSESNSSVEVAEAFRELMQVRLLVNIDTPRLDIEEATLSFSRSCHRNGMPTLRSFVSIQWLGPSGRLLSQCQGELQSRGRTTLALPINPVVPDPRQPPTQLPPCQKCNGDRGGWRWRWRVGRSTSFWVPLDYLWPQAFSPTKRAGPRDHWGRWGIGESECQEDKSRKFGADPFFNFRLLSLLPASEFWPRFHLYQETASLSCVIAREKVSLGCTVRINYIKQGWPWIPLIPWFDTLRTRRYWCFFGPDPISPGTLQLPIEPQTALRCARCWAAWRSPPTPGAARCRPAEPWWSYGWNGETMVGKLSSEYDIVN